MLIPVHKRFYVIGSKPWKCKPNSPATATATAWSSSPGHLALMMCLSVCVKSLSTGWTCTARGEGRPPARSTSDERPVSRRAQATIHLQQRNATTTTLILCVCVCVCVCVYCIFFLLLCLLIYAGAEADVGHEGIFRSGVTESRVRAAGHPTPNFRPCISPPLLTSVRDWPWLWQADMWSVGWVVYEILSGTSAFSRKNEKEMFQYIKRYLNNISSFLSLI